MRRGLSNDEAIAAGLEQTAGIITAAALVMLVVFGSFAFTGVLVIKEIGVGLAVAVLVDATIVRVVLVPATMKLLGRWNWWMPSALDRYIPEIDEGDSFTRCDSRRRDAVALSQLDESLCRATASAAWVCTASRNSSTHGMASPVSRTVWRAS